jgi:L-ascorbate metabolism protein UlaG (beta-lactamase superfamily)
MKVSLPSARSLLVTLALALFLGACASVATGVYRGPTSDHFDGRHFHNVERFNDAMIEDALRRTSSILSGDSRGGAKWVTAPTDTPPPRVGGGKLRVTFVNHSTFLVQMDSLNILTDPIWSDRASPFTWAGPKRRSPPGIRFEDLPTIDVVLISHNHYDHMDAPTLARLQREHHPRIFAGLGNAAFVKGRAADLDWWQSAELAEGVRVHAVPAQHFSSRGFSDRDANLWCGYVLETPHGAVYFAGDTGWGPHFDAIRERFGKVRLALLPIGAFRPEWFMCSVHISPTDAVRAAKALGATMSIPMHYSTFHLGDDGQDEPVEVLRRVMGEVPFTVLVPGGTWVGEKG